MTDDVDDGAANLITTHHDGHGLNESITIWHNEPDEKNGGGSHLYVFAIDNEQIGTIQFQQGPRHEQGSTPGVTTAAVLAALIHHLSAFQAGPFKSRETALVITKLEEALHWTRARADARAKRKVLGTRTP